MSFILRPTRHMLTWTQNLRPHNFTGSSGHAEEFRPFDHAEMRVFDHPGFSVYDRWHRVRPFSFRLSPLSSVRFLLLSAYISVLRSSSRSWKMIHLISSHWRDDMDDSQWLEIAVGPSTAMKIFGWEIARSVCGALKGFQEGKGQLKCYPSYAYFR